MSRMRKVISELTEDERKALLLVSDLGVSCFAAALIVEIIRSFIGIFT